MRRADRATVPLRTWHPRCRGAVGDLRVRGRSPYHRPDRGVLREKGLCLHPARGHRDPGVRPADRGRCGPGLCRQAPGGIGRSHHFCAGGVAHPRGPEGLGQRRDRGQRRHPHERHPVFPLQPSLGGAGGPLGGQPDPGRRRGVSSVAPRVPVKTACRPFPWRRPTRPSTGCARARSRAAVLVVGEE